MAEAAGCATTGAGVEADTATTVCAGLGLSPALGAAAGLAAGADATAGAEVTTGAVALWASTAPKTATHTTMASAQAAAANRILAHPIKFTEKVVPTLKEAIPVQVKKTPATA
jgi:hypothetical protein